MIFRDAAEYYGWHEYGEVLSMKVGKVCSSGYMIDLDRDRIAVAADIDDKGMMSRIMIIPRESIVSIRDLGHETIKEIMGVMNNGEDEDSDS